MRPELGNNFYFANQNNGVFDEIQRLIVAYENGQPVAIEGNPGVGKNCAIDAIARIIGKKIYRIRCTEETMARDIIGSDKLAAEHSANGSVATKTVFQPGPLMKAMQEQGIVVIDEANQLTPTVQKALNSALEEERTIGDLEGNVDVKAPKEFGLFITYNPETGVAKDDLEIAVKDRCKIVYFDEQPAELITRMSLLKSGFFKLEDILDDTVSIRGAYKNNGTFHFAELKEDEWHKYKRDEPIEAENIQAYLFYDREKENQLQTKNDQNEEYYQITKAIVKTIEDIKKLKKEGTTNIGQKLDLKLDKIGRLNVNIPSARLAIKLIQDYILLRKNEYQPKEVLSELVRSITDFTVPASERNLNIGETTMQKLIEHICMAHGIVDNSGIETLRKKMRKKSQNELVRELMAKGYSERMAINLIEEHT